MFKDLNVKTLDVIAISMRRRPKNLRNWQRAFRQVQVMNAVVGKKVDITDTKLVNPLVRFQINDISKNDTIYSVPSVGAIGCYLSHMECMKRCVKLQRPIVVIEEDVVFSGDAVKYLERVCRRVPIDCDFLSLMYIRQGHLEPHNVEFGKICGELNGTQCYLVFPRAAQIFLDNCFPMTTQVDLFLGIIIMLTPDITGYALNKRLYSYTRIFIDNLSTSIQAFAIKKYLPSGNTFYYILLLCIALLILGIYRYRNRNNAPTL